MYPLHPDQREFFCIVKKVNDARNHESAAAHLLRDAEYVAQWAARSQQAAEAETQRAAAQEAAHRASRARWVADESEDDDSEDDAPTPEEEEEGTSGRRARGAARAQRALAAARAAARCDRGCGLVGVCTGSRRV